MSANLQQNIEYCDVHIDDLNNIYSLELKSYPHPWTKGILRDCINNHYDFYIAKTNNIIIGYIIAKISIYDLVTYISGTKPLFKIYNIPIHLINKISVLFPKNYIMKLVVYFADIDYISEYSFLKERDISEYCTFRHKS